MRTKDAPTRVVLADDSPVFTSVCRFLLPSGIELTEVAHCGREALDAVDRLAPDVLILDISMPDMSGVEVLEQLADRGAQTRVVVLTMHQDKALADHVIALGARGFVIKSRMARDLAPAIAAAGRNEIFRSPLPPATP